MNISKIKIYLLEIILICILLLNLLLKSNIFQISIILFILALISYFVIKNKNNYYLNKKKAGKTIIIMGIIYVIFLYVLGIYVGFYKSYYILSLKNIIKYVIPISMIIIFSEFIRNRLLVNNSWKSKILIIIMFSLIDYILFASFYNLSIYNDFREAIGLVVFASVSSNILYNYLSPRFGYKYIIIYRLIIILYQYLLPIIPDIYVFFDSFIRLLYPILMYKIISYGYEENNEVLINNTRLKKVLRLLLIILLTVYVGLISGNFKYGALVVGSSSMTGSINKGDMVIYKKYNYNDELNIGDIIIFTSDDKRVIHRIIDIKQVNNELRIFTKGDANQKKDNGYRTKSTIVGIKKRVFKHLGEPSLILRKLFE